MEFYSKRNKSKIYSIKLYTRFKKELFTLSKQPEIGIKTEIASVRGLIVDNYILFYEFDKGKIHVLTLWDSRQNPDELLLG